ncbi:MAG: vWA domain-containing protein, partial [Victivallaceae bacterium]
MLRNSGFEVERYAPEDFRVTPGNLVRYSGVALENVTAGSIGMDGCQLLADMVRNGAIGLMITGGRQSFAVGGYYKSALEAILPVSLEQRREVRKSSMALMVALDRSGSMAMPIGNLTKMDLANQATLEALRQLQGRDEFGLLAVDSAAHWVLPLQPLDEQVDAEKKILSVESMGGGIFTFTALKAAADALSKSNAGIRHLILFADAADAEEPGEYQALLAASSASGITVSVVGLGTEQDCDAVFLKDVAARGGGNIYFSNRADELPQIFVQDVFTMARSAFVQEATAGHFLAAARLGGADKLSGNFEIGGYNLCYIRPEAEQWAVTDDEFNAPLAAVRMVDLGRVSAYTGEADGEYTGKLGNDERAAALLSSLAGYMQLPENSSQDYLVTQKLVNGALRLFLEEKIKYPK